MKKTVLLSLKTWVPLGLVLSALAGMIYYSFQQVYRQSADDPQIQYAEEIAQVLSQGTDPATIVNTENQADLKTSLSPFILIYNDKGENVVSSVVLDGKTPELPKGVLDATKSKVQNKITWEPAKGIRSATVIHYYQDKATGYVMVGRSLREVEKRQAELLKMSAIGWGAAMVVTFISVFLLELLSNRMSKKTS